MSSFAETSVSSEDVPGKDTPDLETLAEDFRLAIEREREVDRLFDHHTAEAERLELANTYASTDRIARRTRLIRRLLEVNRVPPDEPEDWICNPSPVLATAIGDRLFVLARNSEIDPPKDFEEMATSCTLVIIPIETKGGVR